MRKQLTDMQHRVYRFLIEFMEQNKYPPTVREIKSYFNFSSSTSVTTHLKNLEIKGYIIKSNKEGYKGRTLRIVDDIVGKHTVSTRNLHDAITSLSNDGYDIKFNEAVELLGKLNINIV